MALLGQLRGTYLRSAVSCNVFAASHHDQARNGYQHHDTYANAAIPDIQYFGNGHHACRAHHTGNNTDYRKKRVFRKLACDVCRKIRSQARLEGIDKIEKPHTIGTKRLVRAVGQNLKDIFLPGINCNEGAFRPRSRDCFCNSNTVLFVWIVSRYRLRSCWILRDHSGL